MKMYLNGVLFALSTALDHVEGEILGVSDHHSKRVAFMCTQIGEYFNYSTDDLLHLTGAAVMHDNALTEYCAVKRLQGIKAHEVIREELAPHCEMGERNAESLPFYSSIKEVILFHHENADGTGPYSQRAYETPLMAQIIHITDTVDAEFDLSTEVAQKYPRILRWLDENRKTLFADKLVDAFQEALPLHELERIEGTKCVTILSEVLPEKEIEITNTGLINIAGLFARITDYKSHFTSVHSQGRAQKAELMGKFYVDSPSECAQLYVIGALHDIGKLTISNTILEKPSRLNEAEFETMKHHAVASYEMLKDVDHLEEVALCAYLHHEKLDGSGYPLGKTGAELTRNEKLFCCIDIYQALTEERPYKKSLTHKEAIALMNTMVKDGKLDEKITHDIDTCFTMVPF